MTKSGFLCGLVVLALAGTLAGPTAVAAEVLAEFAAQKCNLCHAVPQVGVVAMVKSKKMKGPDLPADSREPDWIGRFLKREVQLEGKDHKKEFKGTEEELRAIVAWLVMLKRSESASE